jgi:O-antigen/teichoic acid export membrane protein
VYLGAPALRLSQILRLQSSAGILLASRLVIIGCGYATYMVVARALSTAEFGVYGVIGAIINVLNTVVGTGTNQAISRLVSRHRDAASSILKRGKWWSLAAGLSLAAGIAVGAPLFAGLLRDKTLTPMLIVAAAIPGLYALNSAYVGFLNGMGALASQGLVYMVLAASRLGLISTAAMLGFGVQGTLYGAIVAALLANSAARLLSRIPAGDAPLDIKTPVFVRMMVSFVGVSLLLQLLLANDVLFIKRLMAPDLADHQAGLYTAAQSIARIPYYLLIGVSQIVYPKLSARATIGGRSPAQMISTLVLSGMLVALAGILAVCLPLTREMMLIIYPTRYSDGASVLGWLLASSAALSIAESAVTMLSGASGPRRPALVLACGVAIQMGLCVVLVPLEGTVGAAQATFIAAGLAALAAAVLLRRVVGTTVPLAIIARTIVPVAGLAITSVAWGRLYSGRPIATALYLAVAYAAFAYAVYRWNVPFLRGYLARSAEARAADGQGGR